ncbi:hypothetical protein I3760_02G199800 [Carya illinoinensis]|uniref:Autophagy-related protein 18c n=1 Tax=Carya illinoinensis TaxID=32201 RepID=A0A922FZU4_CARIL|nr:hypothetical protein I3760_02G199800 [Carya illinoinensis]KAG6728876.1 hypothetical protein I3842_02G196500 [Carya illinoinensis]
MTVPSSHMSSIVSTSRGIHPSTGISTYDNPRAGPSGSFSQPEPESNDCDETELFSVSWNQDYGCFAAGTNHGFRIYNCDPFKETFRRDLKSGGFKIVEMLFRSNILALVGGGANSQYPPNKVMIWDDHQSRCIGEFAFRSEVRAVKLRRDRIIVVLEHKIYVYNFMDLKLLHQIETLANPRGLCCLSHHSNTFVLACPGLQRGQVRIEHFGLNMTKLIHAHDSHIACFTLTMDGLLLASASTKGTVHIFSLRVRVGEDSAAQGLALFQQNSSTSLDALISPNAGSNPSSSLSFMRGVLPKYFSSEWSFAQFHLPEDIQFIAAFGSQNAVIIVGMDGSFYRCRFDPVHGGEMLQQEYVRFLKTESRLR